MKSRALALVVVLAAVLLQPVRVDAFRYGFDPNQPIYGGYLLEDATCPGATHALLDLCTHQRRYYLAFKMKGLKHRLNTYQIVQGPVDTATCSTPLIDVRRIHVVTVPPPPCGP